MGSPRRVHNSRRRANTFELPGGTRRGGEGRINVARLSGRNVVQVTGKAGENGQHSGEMRGQLTLDKTVGSWCGDALNLAPGSLSAGSLAGRTRLLSKRGGGSMYSAAATKLESGRPWSWALIRCPRGADAPVEKSWASALALPSVERWSPRGALGCRPCAVQEPEDHEWQSYPCKRKLLEKLKRACESSWSRPESQKSCTLTFPWNLAKLVKK